MKIAVVGSINTDLVYTIDKAPLKGETLFGNDFRILNGGKGANQAVILSALEENVLFFGALGKDVFGKQYLNHLISLELNGNVLTKESNSGLAVIQLTNNDNSIVVIKGANDLITKYDIDKFFKENPAIEILVAQLEINFDTSKYMIEKAKKMGIKIILNPAPALDLDESIIESVEFLIPNETEAEVIFKTNDLESIVNKYKGKVIITQGEKGVMYYNDNMVKIEPSEKISVVDTTGAGDSFVAGFTSGIANNMSIQDAIKKGIKTASITCKYLGAQTAYSVLKEMKK